MFEPVKDLNDFNAQLRPLLRSKIPQIRDLTKEAYDEIAKMLNILRLFIGTIFCFQYNIYFLAEKFPNLIFDCLLSYRPQTFSQGLVYYFSVDYLELGRLYSPTILAGG